MATASVHLEGLTSQAPGGLERNDVPEPVRSYEALAAAGQLAAGVAHDVNNIVTVIKLYAELLESESELGPRAREQLHAIRTQAERAVSLAWQVLDTAHRQPPQLDDLDLVPFLDEFGEVIGPLLAPGVVLVVRSEGPSHVVRADATRLQQVMTNLVANAAQALGGGGDLTVSVHGEQEWTRIDVADTGVGMAPEVLARVFEPFFSTKPAGKGTGLGLTQVHALVAEHGGHVTIRSGPGEGTVVSVWLPGAGGGAHPHGRAGRRAAVRRGNGELVLVVGDDPVLRAALVETLASLGYRPQAVADGDDALDWLGRSGVRTDAVVSDVAMAGLGGEGLARRMAVAYPEMPIVLTTAAPWVSAGPERPARGRVFRLPKPFSVEQLARVLRAALG